MINKRWFYTTFKIVYSTDFLCAYVYSHSIQIKYNILRIDVVFKRAHIVILLPEEFSAFISFTSHAANIFHASTIMDARKNIAKERATFIIFIYLFIFISFFKKVKKPSGQISVGEKSLNSPLWLVDVLYICMPWTF